MGNLVKNSAIEGNLDIADRRISNTSVRLHCFHTQSALNIGEEEAQVLDGHIDPNTRKKYLRANKDNLDVYGAALGAAATGCPAIVPKPQGEVLMENLQGPKTIKSRTYRPESKESSILQVAMRPKPREMLPGMVASDKIQRYDIVLDGEMHKNDSSLASLYHKANNEKYSGAVDQNVKNGDGEEPMDKEFDINVQEFEEQFGSLDDDDLLFA